MPFLQRNFHFSYFLSPIFSFPNTSFWCNLPRSHVREEPCFSFVLCYSRKFSLKKDLCIGIFPIKNGIFSRQFPLCFLAALYHVVTHIHVSPISAYSMMVSIIGFWCTWVWEIGCMLWSINGLNWNFKCLSHIFRLKQSIWIMNRLLGLLGI